MQYLKNNEATILILLYVHSTRDRDIHTKDLPNDALENDNDKRWNCQHRPDICCYSRYADGSLLEYIRFLGIARFCFVSRIHAPDYIQYAHTKRKKGHEKKGHSPSIRMERSHMPQICAKKGAKHATEGAGEVERAERCASTDGLEVICDQALGVWYKKGKTDAVEGPCYGSCHAVKQCIRVS